MNVSWLKKFILYFVIERATSKTITTMFCNSECRFLCWQSSNCLQIQGTSDCIQEKLKISGKKLTWTHVIQILGLTLYQLQPVT